VSSPALESRAVPRARARASGFRGGIGSGSKRGPPTSRRGHARRIAEITRSVGGFNQSVDQLTCESGLSHICRSGVTERTRACLDTAQRLCRSPHAGAHVARGRVCTIEQFAPGHSVINGVLRPLHNAVQPTVQTVRKRRHVDWTAGRLTNRPVPVRTASWATSPILSLAYTSGRRAARNSKR